MAVSLHSGGRPGGGRRNRARRHTPMHEINVTPFVDVMLVLLIVFMVTAPLLLSGLPVDLPSVKGQGLNVNQEQLTLTLDREGRVFLGSSEEPLEIDQLAANTVLSSSCVSARSMASSALRTASKRPGSLSSLTTRSTSSAMSDAPPKRMRSEPRV